ncbi:MAG TPA: hypothetical protein VMI35_00595 [Puia sp.]|nr:hypothetical protein [Puia sp.]
MKQPLLYCLALLPCMTTLAQTGSPKPVITTDWKDSSPPPSGTPQWNFLADPDWKAATQAYGVEWGAMNGIKGSLFYDDEWVNGSILLTDHRQAANIPLRFNVYSNEIYFMRDSQVLAIDGSVPVREFVLYDHRDDIGGPSIFRCGYPDTKTGNQKTFYQVLADGSYSLLIQYTKKIIDKNNPIEGPQRVVSDEEIWYVLSAADHKMVEIHRNKSSLLSALPAASDKINTIIANDKLKLKQKSDWVTLFKALNKS